MVLETKAKGKILRGRCKWCDYCTCHYKKHRKSKKLCSNVRKEVKSKSMKTRLRREMNNIT